MDTDEIIEAAARPLKPVTEAELKKLAQELEGWQKIEEQTLETLTDAWLSR